MAMKRVRFQAGLSMPEFLQRCGTEAQCRQALQAARWPSGFVCPACSGAARTSFERGGLRYRQRGQCNRRCSLMSGGVFAASKLPLTRWFLAMQLLTQAKNNVWALDPMRQLGVSYCTAWLIKHELVERMRRREDGRELDGRVELDDVHLGGERSDGKSRRRPETKVRIVAAVQTTADGQPVLACLRQHLHTAEEVAVFAAGNLALSATVVSDGLWCFSVTTMAGARLQRIATGGDTASVKLPQFRSVNTVPGNLKTAITDAYLALAFAMYAHCYLAELQYRFDRRFNMKTFLPRLLAALVAAPPSPEHWLLSAEVPC